MERLGRKTGAFVIWREDLWKRSGGSRSQVVENPPVIEGRIPPHDLEAEAGVLSAVMLDPSAMDKITDLKAEYFYSEAHRRIFEACFELRQGGHPVDVLQVMSWLKDRGRLNQVGGAPYLTEILDAAPVVANVAAYGQIIHEKFRIRSLILACQRGVGAGLRRLRRAAVVHRWRRAGHLQHRAHQLEAERPSACST